MSVGVPDDDAVNRLSTSCTLVAPDLRMASRDRVCTGDAVSTSICLMRLPVISTRWGASGAEAAAPGAAAVCAKAGAAAAAQAMASSERRNTRARVEFCVFMGSWREKNCVGDVNETFPYANLVLSLTGYSCSVFASRLTPSFPWARPICKGKMVHAAHRSGNVKPQFGARECDMTATVQAAGLRKRATGLHLTAPV